MPIRPDLKALYPPDWKQISHLVRFERAGGCCEHCGARHGWYRLKADGSVFDPIVMVEQGLLDLDTPVSLVWLTTAHLNHDPSDNRPENLAALCQKCHLAHDLQHHLASRRINREKRSGQGRLFDR